MAGATSELETCGGSRIRKGDGCDRSKLKLSWIQKKNQKMSFSMPR